MNNTQSNDLEEVKSASHYRDISFSVISKKIEEASKAGLTDIKLMYIISDDMTAHLRSKGFKVTRYSVSVVRTDISW